jgi:hypothetical protein
LDNYDVVKKHLFIHVGFGQFLGLSFFASWNISHNGFRQFLGYPSLLLEIFLIMGLDNF